MNAAYANMVAYRQWLIDQLRRRPDCDNWVVQEVVGLDHSVYFWVRVAGDQGLVLGNTNSVWASCYTRAPNELYVGTNGQVPSDDSVTPIPFPHLIQS